MAIGISLNVSGLSVVEILELARGLMDLENAQESVKRAAEEKGEQLEKLDLGELRGKKPIVHDHLGNEVDLSKGNWEIL